MAVHIGSQSNDPLDLEDELGRMLAQDAIVPASTENEAVLSNSQKKKATKAKAKAAKPKAATPAKVVPKNTNHAFAHKSISAQKYYLQQTSLSQK